jgi:hypothetical protein
MRLVILTALFFALGALAILGFLHLVRELLVKDFFHPPSLPSETATQDQEVPQETSSRSANPTV